MYRILVVDDDTSSLDSITGLLTRAGFAVETATDGLEALSRLNRSTPDLMLLDLDMPMLSGFELLHITAQEGIQPLTVVTTRNPSAYTILDALDYRVADYFEKPITEETLDRIRTILAEDKASYPDSTTRGTKKSGKD